METRNSSNDESNKKIKELESRLKSNRSKNVSNYLGNLNLATLADNLFEKAPSLFIETSTVNDLVSISERCFETCEQYFATKASVYVTSGIEEDHSYLIIALGDRPFIVNSVILSVRECGSDIQTLLHPLVALDNGRRLSLMYVRIDSLNAETLNLLQERIKRSLEDLVLVTEDHPTILSQVETVARLLKERVPTNTTESERNEVSEFLRWLSDGGFVFLGYSEWRIEEESNEKSKIVRYIDDSPKILLGLFKSTNPWSTQLKEECRKDALRALESPNLLSISKLLFRSIVHRSERASHVVLPQYGSDGTVTGIISVVGLFTSKTLSQESSTIPSIREKVKKLISLEQAIPNTFSYKNIIKIIDSMPKELLLRSEVETINQHLKMITGIQRESESAALVHADPSGRGVNVTVAMPRKRFSEQVRTRLQKHIEYTFGAAPGSGDLQVSLNVKPLVLFYYHIPVSASHHPIVDMTKLELDLIDLTKTWLDNLHDRIILSETFEDPENIWLKYRNSFHDEYQASFTVQESYRDITIIEKLTNENSIKVDISGRTDFSEGLFQLSLYSWQKELAVSHVLPILEHAGLHIIREQAHQITGNNSATTFLHRFIAITKDKNLVNIEAFKDNLCTGLEKVLSGEADSDVLNSLLISANLEIRAITLLRAYCAYLFQISAFISKGTIRNTLAAVPSAATLLWNIFEVRFNPELKLSPEKRNEKFEAIKKHFLLALRNVPDITQDRNLRVFLSLLESTVRTNFFSGRNTIAFKIDPSKVDVISEPRPFREIYVRGPEVEGIHIRFGAVARGGIRWSDRRDDFRNEVIGLAKTQKVKNVVIVPTGSKGGFIVRHPTDVPEQVPTQVKSCYQDYIRALLSITDNRVRGSVQHPENVVVYDGEDPYLVVAADKGTATFSDTANKIAVDEYNFWLADAFASGGSQGYDHKHYAITANGAWECVKRHFKDIGINYENQPFSVVGIGDLSGDVFGNGLVYSDKIKLLAAFNHKHIFLDPNPDPSESFQERKRLFTLPRSQWSDYNPKLISKGGGVFGRYDKEITLSAPIREALSVPENTPETINGEQLISLMLKAKVDLLWNGGIGTYFKASTETNTDVNDGTNDAVRVDAKDMRAKVIGEGGNLGFTQLGRIEFERCGGKLNTDAIDNSGGVDLSDHEVNYKIFFSGLLEQKKITLEERNKVLKEVAEFACADVLQNNASHAILLTLGSLRSSARIEIFKGLIRELSREGYLNRVVDTLPDDESLGRLAKTHTGLTRPELSKIYAAVKMQLRDVLLNSKLPNDPHLEKYLIGYFPPVFAERWQKELLQHPLRNQIIAMKLVGELVNTMGATFVFRICKNFDVDSIEVLTAYVAVAEMLDLAKIKNEIKKLDTVASTKQYIEACQRLNVVLSIMISSIIEFGKLESSISKIKETFEKPFKELLPNLLNILSVESQELFKTDLAKFKSFGLSDLLATTLSVSPFIASLFEVIWISNQSGQKLNQISELYNSINTLMGLEDVLHQLENFSAPNKWDQLLLSKSKVQIRKSVCKLVIKAAETKQKDISFWLSQNSKVQKSREIAADLKTHGISIAGIAIISEELNSND